MKIIKSFLILFCVMYSLSSSAIEFRFGEYNIAEQGIASCFGDDAQSCRIEFEKPFTTTPLVFLMPTIEEGNGRDAPSTLRLINVTKSSATFRQYIAPRNSNAITLKPVNQTCSPNDKSNYCLEKVVMKKVRYFAIEQGTLNFGDKGRIEAGLVNVNKYLAGGHKLDNSKPWRNTVTVNYNDAFNNPGVLVSIQGNGQSNIGQRSNWITPIVPFIDRGNNKMYVALDRSELQKEGHDQGANKKVAYIVAEGRGSYKGLQFAMGAGATFDTLIDNLDQFDQVTEPVLRQCAATVPVPSGFSEPPFIIATKNSRKGNNGGWIRLCRLEESNHGYRVSFVNDEDLNENKKKSLERKHKNEDIGFMAFQRKVDEKTCDVFPGPAQTWESHSQDQHAKMQHEARINGTYFENNKRYLWFKSTGSAKKGCDGVACNKPDRHVSVERWAVKPQLDDFSSSSSGTRYDGDNTLPEYGQFWLNGETVKLKDGSGEKINDLQLDNGSTLNLYPGTYWFEKLILSAKSKIITHGNVVIHSKYINLSTFSSISPANNTPDSLLIYAHGSEYNINHINVDLSKGSSLTALLYSGNKVTMAGGGCKKNSCEVTSITGSVTAANIDMNSSNRFTSTVINGKSSCFDSTPNYELSLSPVNAENMLCKSQKLTFSLNADNGDGSLFNGSINVSVKAKQGTKASGRWSSKVIDENNKGTVFEHGIPFVVPVSIVDNNSKDIWIKSDNLGELELTATFDGLSGNQPKGVYRFIPGGFQISPTPVSLIAGRPAKITVKAMACDVGNDVVTEYSGEKSLAITTSYVKPSTANTKKDKLELQNTAGTDKNTWEKTFGDFYFVKGVAKDIPIRYLDAGELSLTLSDPNCTEKECNLDELTSKQLKQARASSSWKGMVGKTTVKSRPYTFALCNDDNQDAQIQSATGTSESGNAFVAAGAEFGLKVKPVVWVEKEDSNRQDIDGHQNATSPVDSRGMCSRKETSNFYADGAPKATVALSIPGDKPHSPNKDGAMSGTLTSSPLSNTQINNTPFSATWDEVGSIWLQADTQVEYLGMNINKGQRPVGRFYPDYFAVVQSDSGIQYPAGQGFVYMDQPFEGRVKIEARNVNDQPTKNYGYFASGLQVGLGMEAVDADIEFGSKNRLSDRVDWNGLPAGWSKGWQGAHNTVEWSPLMFQRKVASFAQGNKGRITTADGPYNVALGVLTDDLSFEECEKIGCPEISGDMDIHYCGPDEDCNEPRAAMKFGQFNTRYGRMVMKDAAGRADSNIAIPLRVEFWDGIEFVLNNEDSVSEYDGRYSCKQIIANSADKLEQGESSNSYTQGSGKVRNGNTQPGQFVAVPHLRDGKPVDGYREQVRFWQRLTANKPNNIKQVNKAISCIGSHSSQPWLLYNWRNVGDENPSAVVTFGVYRGNDRIIYRGEKGINTLLN